MEDNKGYKCSGDCLRCHPNQRQYCAAQFTFNTMKMVESIQVTVNEMKEKIEAMQNNEALLFDPTQEENEAQSGDGAVQ